MYTVFTSTKPHLCSKHKMYIVTYKYENEYWPWQECLANWSNIIRTLLSFIQLIVLFSLLSTFRQFQTLKQWDCVINGSIATKLFSFIFCSPYIFQTVPVHWPLLVTVAKLILIVFIVVNMVVGNEVLLSTSYFSESMSSAFLLISFKTSLCLGHDVQLRTYIQQRLLYL